jgi:hypothetical protein
MSEQGLPSTVTSPAERDPCPSCGAITGVRWITGTPLKAQAWSCGACGTEWVTSVVNPRPFLNLLTASVELAMARSVLGELIRLADQAPVLTEEQLRFRLLTLAACAALHSPAPSRSPAGHRSRALPRPFLDPRCQPAPQHTPGTAVSDHRDADSWRKAPGAHIPGPPWGGVRG